MVTVGFNPRVARPQNNPRRGATHEIASGRMTPVLFNRRSATEYFLGIAGIRGLKPTATIEPSLRDGFRLVALRLIFVSSEYLSSADEPFGGMLSNIFDSRSLLLFV